MTISEYDIHGVVSRDSRSFFHAVRNQLTVLRHSHGPEIEDSQPRAMHAAWALDEYARTGDRSQLVKAAAWLCAEWGG